MKNLYLQESNLRQQTLFHKQGRGKLLNVKVLGFIGKSGILVRVGTLG